MIRRKIPWASQPQYPVGLNPAWAEKMAFAITPLGQPWYDEWAKKVDGFALSGVRSTGIGRLGKFVGFDGSSYYTNTSVITPPPVSFLVVARGAPSTTNCLLGGSGNGSVDLERVQFDFYNGIPRSIFVNTAGGAAAATSTAAALATDEDFVCVFTIDSSLVPRVYFRNKVTVGSAGSGSVGTYTGFRVGATMRLTPSALTNKPIYLAAAWGRCFTDAEAFSLIGSISAPWQIFAPQERRIFVSVASSGITGTFSVTESVDVPAISGLVNHTGSLAVTESSDIASISGSIAHLGNLSVTELGDTFAASGTISGSATITGSLVITEISDTASLTGGIAHTGTLTVTETADTVSFNGLVAHTGALAVTESADVVAITGGSQITITGSIAITESPDVADFRGPSTNTFSQEVEFRKYYVRKGKKILLFDSVDEAEEYIKAEQVAEEAIAKAKVSSRQERRKIKKRIIKDVLPAESIDTDWLAEMMQRFAINFDLPKLLAEQDYNRVMEIYAMAKAMQDDEDDIEMLLMWG